MYAIRSYYGDGDANLRAPVGFPEYRVIQPVVVITGHRVAVRFPPRYIGIEVGRVHGEALQIARDVPAERIHGVQFPAVAVYGKPDIVGKVRIFPGQSDPVGSKDVSYNFV